MSESSIVQVTVLEVTGVHRNRVLALADVELSLDGIVFALHGIRVSRVLLPGGQTGTAVDLPMYRSPAGDWKSAVSLPDELRQPIADAVLARCCELGITKQARAFSIEPHRLAS